MRTCSDSRRSGSIASVSEILERDGGRGRTCGGLHVTRRLDEHHLQEANPCRIPHCNHHGSINRRHGEPNGNRGEGIDTIRAIRASSTCCTNWSRNFQTHNFKYRPLPVTSVSLITVVPLSAKALLAEYW